MFELLFSDGTPRQRDVEVATFGREIEGYVDAIIGYDLDDVTITDPHVIAASGSDRHPILRPTDRPDAQIEGTVFTLNEAEWSPPTTTRSTNTAGFPYRCGPGRKPGSMYSPVNVHRPQPIDR